MNTIVTSKEDILKNSRDLILREGLSALNVRSVAAACGVSVGSIYNYFSSKSELMCAIIESIWCEIFHQPEDPSVFQDIQSCVSWIYDRMAYGYKQYPGFFTFHSLVFIRDEKSDGEQLMYKTWNHILDGLYSVLIHDSKIRPDAFNEQFTQEKFANIIFSLMLSAMFRQDYNPSVVLEVIRRTLY